MSLPYVTGPIANTRQLDCRPEWVFPHGPQLYVIGMLNVRCQFDKAEGSGAYGR